MDGVYRVIVEGDWNVHNLCHIAPEEPWPSQISRSRLLNL